MKLTPTERDAEIHRLSILMKSDTASDDERRHATAELQRLTDEKVKEVTDRIAARAVAMRAVVEEEHHKRIIRESGRKGGAD
jgi:hypothetical protein